MVQYPGGKNSEGLKQWICGFMPYHRNYAECFAGSAAIARAKWPSETTIIIDLDDEVLRTGSSYPTWQTSNECGILWLEKNAWQLNRDWLVYLDPPYPPECRVKTSMYKFEMSAARHDRLLAVISQLDCFVMISSYFSRRYAKALDGWHLETKQARTRGNDRIEHLWMNFDPSTVRKPPSLQRAPNFRARERVKRKCERWVKNLMMCEPWEREYIFDQLRSSLATTDVEAGNIVDAGDR